MTKHPYQTCLRMPLTLKEDMTTICDRYRINESDLMRRAIVEFVTNIQRTQIRPHVIRGLDPRISTSPILGFLQDARIKSWAIPD